MPYYAPRPHEQRRRDRLVIADDHNRSLITTQVEMGVATRMACLEAVSVSAQAQEAGNARTADKCPSDMPLQNIDANGWFLIENGIIAETGNGMQTAASQLTKS